MKTSELTVQQVREYKRILKWVSSREREDLVTLAAECAFACREVVDAVNAAGARELRDWPDLDIAVRQAAVATEEVPGAPSLRDEGG